MHRPYPQFGMGAPAAAPAQATQFQPQRQVTAEDILRRLDEMDRMYRGIQSSYDKAIGELYQKMEALSRPGAHAMRPIGEWGWYSFSLVHTGSESQQDSTRVADQFEFWATYLVGSVSTGATTSYTIRITDTRSNTYLDFESQMVAANLLLGSITQPHVFAPPRIMGSQITVESDKTDSGAATLSVVMCGIQVNVRDVYGATFGQ